MSVCDVTYFATIHELKSSITNKYIVIGCIECKPSFITSIYRLYHNTDNVDVFINDNGLDEQRFELYKINTNIILINARKNYYAAQIVELIRISDLMFIFNDPNNIKPRWSYESIFNQVKYTNDLYIMYVGEESYVPTHKYKNWNMQRNYQVLPINTDTSLVTINDIKNYFGIDIVQSLMELLTFCHNDDNRDDIDYDDILIKRVSTYLCDLLSGFVKDRKLLSGESFDEYFIDVMRNALFIKKSNEYIKNLLIHVIGLSSFEIMAENVMTIQANIRMYQLILFFMNGIHNTDIYNDDVFWVETNMRPKRMMPYLVACLKWIDFRFYDDEIQKIMNKYDRDSNKINPTPLFDKYVRRTKHDMCIDEPLNDLYRYIDLNKFVTGFDKVDTFVYEYGVFDAFTSTKCAEECMKTNTSPRKLIGFDTVLQVSYNRKKFPCLNMRDAFNVPNGSKVIPITIPYWYNKTVKDIHNISLNDFCGYVYTNMLPKFYPIFDTYVSRIESIMNPEMNRNIFEDFF